LGAPLNGEGDPGFRYAHPGYLLPSLRAKRSNPETLAGLWIASSLALLAMTGPAWSGDLELFAPA
jgi:hypothetical protein